MKIIIGVVFIFMLFCIWTSISDSISRSKYEQERKEYEQKQKEEDEKKAAAARKKYPKIKNWNEHPLFALASAFLVETVNNYITVAKRTPTGVGGGIVLKVLVETSRIHIENTEISFFYSNCGYDRIKVGYTEDETREACKEFAAALSTYLSDYYMSRENISFEKAYAYYSDDCGAFYVNLKNLQPKLKQV